MSTIRKISTVIKDIREINDIEFDYIPFRGYIIETDTKPIKFFIENRVNYDVYDIFVACKGNICGKMPFMKDITSVDLDTLDIIGAQVSSIGFTNKELNETVRKGIDGYKKHSAMININTDRGIIQLVAWNEPSSYPRTLHVEWDDIEEEQDI